MLAKMSSGEVSSLSLSLSLYHFDCWKKEGERERQQQPGKQTILASKRRRRRRQVQRKRRKAVCNYATKTAAAAQQKKSSFSSSSPSSSRIHCCYLKLRLAADAANAVAAAAPNTLSVSAVSSSNS